MNCRAARTRGPRQHPAASRYATPICKVGRDDQIDLMHEGLDGLRRLGSIADKLMLRTGGCSGCQLAGTCRVCRPLAKQFQEAKAPRTYYCQHGDYNRRSA